MAEHFEAQSKRREPRDLNKRDSELFEEGKLVVGEITAPVSPLGEPLNHRNLVSIYYTLNDEIQHWEDVVHGRRAPLFPDDLDSAPTTLALLQGIRAGMFIAAGKVNPNDIAGVQKFDLSVPDTNSRPSFRGLPEPGWGDSLR